MAAISTAQNSASHGSGKPMDEAWKHTRANNKVEANTNFSYRRILPSQLQHAQTSQTEASPHETIPTQPNDMPSSNAYAGTNGTSNQQYPAKPPAVASLAGQALGKPENPRLRVGNLTRTDSENDSLLELYHQQRSPLNPTHSNAQPRQIVASMPDDDDPESSRWIHRDKLAMIEIQELRAAGIKIPPERDILSRSMKHQERGNDKDARDVAGYEETEPAYEDQRQRGQSPVENEGSDDGKALFDDPRTPEEIAADPYEEGVAQQAYHLHGIRASSSRIPLSTSSPAPVPQEHLERSTPLPRKRGVSGNWDEEGIAYNKTRSRKNSVGSQILLDDGEDVEAPQSPRSPSKRQTSRTPASKTSNTRNVSAGGLKPRTTSISSRNSPAARPTTSSGRAAVNRPEGDPPWLATMYKPDPRLPPDQQILPTHAKRLMQERWEKEGQPASSFGKDFAPIALSTKDPPRATSSNEKPGADDNSWPLKPILSEPAGKSPMAEHGRYSTIPKVQSTPTIGTVQGPRLQQQQQEFQQSLKEPEADKGCGCCLVM